MMVVLVCLAVGHQANGFQHQFQSFAGGYPHAVSAMHYILAMIT